MHPNQAFRKPDAPHNIAFARDRSFGMLALNADPAPMISHIPFQLSEDGQYLEAHLVRSNPILTLLDKPRAAVMAVNGGDSYVSPDWYGVEQLVPTWNYVAVHLRGQLRRLPQADLRGVLERLSLAMETRLLPKSIWGLEKLTDENFAKMARMIVPVAMHVDQVDGTWKLGQNKPPASLAGAAAGVSEYGFGVETNKLAALMQDPPG